MISKVVLLCVGAALLASPGWADLSTNPDDLSFLFYSGPTTSKELVYNDPTSFNGAPFKSGKGTVIVIDGFLSNYTTPMSQTTKNEYLQTRSDLNIIVLDWGKLSGSGADLSGGLIGTGILYSNVLKNVGPVGERVCDFIHFLGTEQNVQAGNVHIVGHSLGAHIAGAAGMFSQEKYGTVLGRVSGLDPAGPFFSLQPDERLRLDKTDAVFVDIYHSNRGTLGDSAHRTGSINVYINGGDNQPGCEEADNTEGMAGYCSHSFSWKFFNYATQHSYKGCPCSGFECQCSNCDTCSAPNDMIVLGEFAPLSATGAYHVHVGPIP